MPTTPPTTMLATDGAQSSSPVVEKSQAYVTKGTNGVLPDKPVTSTLYTTPSPAKESKSNWFLVDTGTMVGGAYNVRVEWTTVYEKS